MFRHFFFSKLGSRVEKVCQIFGRYCAVSIVGENNKQKSKWFIARQVDDLDSW